MDHKGNEAGDLDPVREACRMRKHQLGELARRANIGHVALEAYLGGARLGVDARQALARAIAALDADAPPPRR